MVVVVGGGGEEKRKGCMKKTHRVYTGLYTPSKTKKKPKNSQTPELGREG